MVGMRTKRTFSARALMAASRISVPRMVDFGRHRLVGCVIVTSSDHWGRFNVFLTNLNERLIEGVVHLGKREFKKCEFTGKLIDARKFLTMDDLNIMELSRSAVWVFDIDQFKVIWVNSKALDLWKAESKQELFQRAMGDGISVSAANRLKQFQTDFRANKIFDELWTIYPKGEPRQIKSRFRGIILENGRMAMLCEAEPFENETCDVIRSSQALLYTSAMVSLYSKSGDCLYANPAARQSHAFGFSTLKDRLCSSTLAKRLLHFSDGVCEGKLTTNVVTFQGERTHEIDARVSYDAVTGQPALHLTEIDITEREKAKQKLAKSAQQDALTGLLNRNGFMTKIRKVLLKTAKSGEKCTLFFLDVDRFKNVNDTLGHRVGDAVLIAIAERLRRTLPKKAVIARFGGDEFLILLPSLCGKMSVAKIGETLLTAFRQPIHYDEQELLINVSLGRSEFPRDGTTVDDLLQSADLALYRAKESGGAKIGIFESFLAERQNQFVKVESALREAIKTDGFELRYQPIVDLETGEIAGAEALIRLNTRYDIASTPDEFIRVAEVTGQINEIGRWVLKEAASKSISLIQNGQKICISANLSAQQFTDPLLLPCLREICQKPDFDPKGFKLEITESILVPNNDALQRIMDEITEMGISFSIDDFGTAFSNLAALQRYPISCIKIDRSLTQSDNFQPLVRSVIAVGREFGHSIVAEGVETVTQLNWLQSNGCNFYQGFLFSKALPFESFAQLVASEAAQTV